MTHKQNWLRRPNRKYGNLKSQDKSDISWLRIEEENSVLVMRTQKNWPSAMITIFLEKALYEIMTCQDGNEAV